MAAANPEEAPPKCKLCNSSDHRTKECPPLVEISADEEFAMVTDQGEDLRPKARKNPRPVGRKSGDGRPQSALAAQTATARASMGEIPGLMAEELEMVAKRRAKQAVAKN